MTESTARRRGRAEDAIYFDETKSRYVGAVSLGFGPDGKRIRRKVTGRTKQDVRDKLKALHAELDRGLRTSSAYTVQQTVADWLEGGLPGRAERTRSVYREALAPLMGQIGNKPLRELTAGDVRGGLEALSGRLSTRYLQIAKASLARAIRYAEAHDLVGRNVATLVDPPKGAVGRPSRSLTLEQALALLDAARESRLNAYVVLSLTVGIRTEEARELRWDHVDLDGGPGAARPVPPSVAVWHSVRQGGDTKTAKSRRTLALPQTAIEALREHRKRQAEDRLAAGALWQDHGGRWRRPRMGTVGSAAHLRLPDVSRRRSYRGDCAPSRPQPDLHYRTCLPPRAASCHHHGCRGDGPDLVPTSSADVVDAEPCEAAVRLLGQVTATQPRRVTIASRRLAPVMLGVVIESAVPGIYIAVAVFRRGLARSVPVELTLI
jgi:integrase